jgi:hypothetical protein
MSLNYRKSFTAPFKTSAPDGLVKIYLISIGFILVIWILHAIFTFMGFASSVFICLIHLAHLIIVVATQSVQTGYFLETIKMEIQNKPDVLPGWKGKYGYYFWHGTIIQVIILVYIIGLLCITIGSFFLMGFFFPVDLSNLPAVSIKTDSTTMTILLFSLSGLFPVLYMLIILFLLPFIIVRYAAEEKITASFQLIKLFFKILKHPLDYIIAGIITIVLSIIVFVISAILCLTVIGWVVGAVVQFIFIVIAFNMFAQIYRQTMNSAAVSE